MQKRVVFFLRAYNDVDNIVPIIFHLLESRLAAVTVVLTTGRELAKDYRIAFLRNRFNLELLFLDDHRPSVYAQILSGLTNRRRLKEVLKFRIGNGKANNVFKSDEKLAVALYRQLEQSIEPMVFCFDWTGSAFAKGMTDVARANGIKSLALPHGASPYVNKLQTKYAINFKESPDVSLTFFDLTVMPTELNQQVGFPEDIDRKKIPAWGSARYTRKWVDFHIENMLDKFQWKGTGTLNLVYFLRCTQYAVHFEELYKTIEILCQYKEVNLVIKYHTRLSDLAINKLKFSDFLQKFTNLKVAYDDISSTALILWSDVIINLGTSAVNEAVWFDKMIFSPDYMHPNITTTGHFFPSSVINTRDDWHHFIRKAIERNGNFTYTTSEKEHFIHSMIEYPDAHVLKRYAEGILSAFDD